MAKTFRPYAPDQMLLMPPALGDRVPEDHLARFVRGVVDALDPSAIEDTYTEERGYPPYDPRMMTTVLLYAYCTGTYSSRKIARQLVDSVACRFLAAGNQPDFRTLSEFRRRHGAALAALFVQGLKLCRQAGLVKLGGVAVDGTKLKANASKHKAMSYGRMRTEEARLAQEVRAPQAHRAGAHRAARPAAAGAERGGADAAHAGDGARPAPVRAPESDRRAGLRADQTCARLPAVPAPRAATRAAGVDLGLS